MGFTKPASALSFRRCLSNSGSKRGSSTLPGFCGCERACRQARVLWGAGHFSTTSLGKEFEESVCYSPCDRRCHRGQPAPDAVTAVLGQIQFIMLPCGLQSRSSAVHTLVLVFVVPEWAPKKGLKNSTQTDNTHCCIRGGNAGRIVCHLLRG